MDAEAALAVIRKDGNYEYDNDGRDIDGLKVSRLWRSGCTFFGSVILAAVSGFKIMSVLTVVYFV